jgi:hypothetical protein
MLGLYVLFLAAGIYFFLQSTILADRTQWRMLVQSLILVVLGMGGMRLSFRRES